MGMDALTSAAFDSLTKDVLPKLLDQLQAFAVLSPEERMADPELAALVGEAQELLGLMGQWFGGGESAPAETSVATEELDDAEAMALLAEAEDAQFDGVQLTGKRSPEDSLSLEDTIEDAPVGGGGDSDMSDDEARMLLAEMDAPLVPVPAPKAAALDEHEMSDAEARRLLAEMDAPVTPANADGAMSDDEARRLLAEMDAPAAAQAAPEDRSAGASEDGEMSDDEAMALLAGMDAPAAAPASKAAATAAKAPRSAPKTISADEEAMQLLMSMGGGDDSMVAAPIVPPSTSGRDQGHANVSAPDEGGHDEDDGEALTEIDEFSKNDFASDPDMMNDFNSNTDELMQTLDSEILKLEQNPEDKETIESIFRAAHTLKGAAGMFGFKSIERVMHRMENLFEQVRKGRLRPDGNTIDVVFQGLDVLRALLEAVRSGKPSGVKTVPIVTALSLAAKGKYVKSDAKPGASAASAPAPRAEASGGGGGGGESGENGGGGGGGAGKKKQDPANNTIRVDLERLDHLVNLVGELVIDRTRFATIEEEVRTFNPQIKVAGHLSETVQLFGRHMAEVHEIIMKIRMVPIGNAFNKFTRIVRDLSRQLGKEIELIIDGEDTELDKTLVEQIGDPLIHLIRNSCDHGIEMPDVRRGQGKSPMGKVFLGARQEGNHIIITIEDDGKGLDVERIRKKGIERGLISEDQTLSKHEIFNLIFEAGFSTADKVTTVSGRGVGMDVVRKQISKLKGIIDLDSEVGRGTTTTIRLPLTLAIVQSLLVEVQQETFAIPLSTVVESVRIKPEEIQRVGDAEVIKRHDKVLPLMYLHEILSLAAKKDHSWYAGVGRQEDIGQHHSAMQRLLRRKERLYVVIVGTGDRRFGIVVDQLLTQQEMVIKSLGPIMRNTPCVAGGAVLGNGEVVLVLDVQELEDTFRSKNRQMPAAA